MVNINDNSTVTLLVHYAAPGLITSDLRWRKVAESIHGFQAVQKLSIYAAHDGKSSFELYDVDSFSTNESASLFSQNYANELIIGDNDNLRNDTVTSNPSPRASNFLGQPKSMLAQHENRQVFLDSSCLSTSVMTTESYSERATAELDLGGVLQPKLRRPQIPNPNSSPALCHPCDASVLVPRSVRNQSRQKNHSKGDSTNQNKRKLASTIDNTYVKDSFSSKTKLGCRFEKVRTIDKQDKNCTFARTRSYTRQQHIIYRKSFAKANDSQSENLNLAEAQSYLIQPSHHSVDRSRKRLRLSFGQERGFITDSSVIHDEVRSRRNTNAQPQTSQSSPFTASMACTESRSRHKRTREETQDFLEDLNPCMSYLTKKTNTYEAELGLDVWQKVSSLPDRTPGPTKSQIKLATTPGSGASADSSYLFIPLRLARMATEAEVSTKFKPAMVLRNVRNVERGYWNIRVNLARPDYVTWLRQAPSSSQLSDFNYLLNDCTTSSYSLASDCKDVINIKEILHPDLSPTISIPWTPEEFFGFFQRLQAFVSKGIGGIGVRLTIEDRQQGDDGIRIHLRLWSWGEVVSHLWLAMLWISDGLIESLPLEWIGSESKSIIRMTGQKQRGGDLGPWIQKGSGEQGYWGTGGRIGRLRN